MRLLFLLILLYPTTPLAQSLDELIAASIPSQPAIQAELTEAASMTYRAATYTHPDPMLMLGAENVPWNSFSFTEDPMTALMLQLSQDFYWPGTLSTQRAEARAQASAMRAAVPEMANMLWAEAIDPYYALLEADRRTDVLSARRAVLQTLAEAARAAYEARMATLSQTLRITAELSSLDLELAEVRRERRTMLAELNGLLNRPAAEPITPRPSPDPSLSAADWLTLATENRPVFDALASEENWLQTRRDAAETMDNPMWRVALAWMFRFQESETIETVHGTTTEAVGTDMITLQVGMTLPFFSSQRTGAELQEIATQSEAVDLRRQETFRALNAEIGRTLETLDSLDDELATLEQDLIPSIQAIYESALAHYASSHEGIEGLIEIQDQLLMLEMTRAELLTARDRAYESLRALAGDSDALRGLEWSPP